jgi:predicted metalloprotease
MGRRRDYDEGYEDARRDMADRETGSRGGGAFTAAMFIKYVAIVIVVLIIAYVVLRILGVIQTAF